MQMYCVGCGELIGWKIASFPEILKGKYIIQF
ncbi:hypothetical protein F8388_022547 [Cannabis sativa]|uniref:Yippee domain-containing protein n=1 Tax=Cannabis sativa TaxID=3483 RepID=A0A7J6I265_CANSA|nr:hypothetical protein F8388_022547 [Cannabis sativa]KAF4401496.1 hypothetical protein G4B88_001690 [Cannabis sativa]